MSRALLLAGGLVLVLACPSRAAHEGPARVDDLPDRGPDSNSSSTTEPTPDSNPALSDPDGDGCERVCGQLHDCLLTEPASTTNPHQAAGLELDCLQQCIDSGPAVTDSRFAGCAELERCELLLPCMRAAWPVAPEESVEPTIEPNGSEGCALGCKRLGECFDSSPEGIDECARGCERQLDVGQQTAFGECMRISDCIAMLECMQAFPGA